MFFFFLNVVCHPKADNAESDWYYFMHKNYHTVLRYHKSGLKKIFFDGVNVKLCGIKILAMIVLPYMCIKCINV